MKVVFVVTAGECRLPVRCQPGGDVPPRDLSNDVAPEKRAVNQPHRLRVPVELGFLGDLKTQPVRVLLNYHPLLNTLAKQSGNKRRKKI